MFSFVMEMDMEIKYEDEDILVVVKPPGLAVQNRQIGQADAVSMLKNYRRRKGEEAYIGLVHRLDQPVGGLLVFAKQEKAAADLSRQIQNHRMEKYYKALVCGRIEEEGVLEDYLVKDKKSNFSRVVARETPGAKKALLSFRKLGTFHIKNMGSFCEKNECLRTAEVSLIEIKLETGRHHQIRVQMAHHGFPLWGDRKYNRTYFGKAEKQANSGGHTEQCALFAWKLGFLHPKTREWMEFTESPEFDML